MDEKDMTPEEKKKDLSLNEDIVSQDASAIDAESTSSGAAEKKAPKNENPKKKDESTKKIFEGEKVIKANRAVNVEEPKKEVIVEEEVKEEVSFEYKNALKKAESYLKCSSFSESDLRKQLEHHEFSEEAIRYALENVDVDYQEECIEKAESYLKCSSFSESDLRKQLEHHEFNSEHIEKAIQETYK